MNIAPVFLSSGEKIRSSYCLRSLVYCSAEPTDVSFLVMDWPQRHRQAEIVRLAKSFITVSGTWVKRNWAARWVVFEHRCTKIHRGIHVIRRQGECGCVCAILTRARIASSRNSRKAMIREYSWWSVQGTGMLLLGGH